jgi:hypothetical protein
MPAEHWPADHVYAERLKHLGRDSDVNGGARGEVFANINANDAVGLITHKIDLGVVDNESVVATIALQVILAELVMTSRI